MKFLIFYFSICILNFTIHGGHTAEYYYHLDGNQINLKFVIEKVELMNFDLKDDCDIKSMTALCMVKYLNKHSSFYINNEKLDFELQNSYTEGDHLVILLNSKWSGDPIKEIIVQNDCFYEHDHHFKNRIIMDVERFQKSYLLKRDRDRIELH